MLVFRYILWGIFAILSLWWPIINFINFLNHKKRVKKIAKMTTIDDYPLFGCALRFLGKTNVEMYEIICDMLAKNGTPLMGWIGPKCIIAVDHPDDIQIVFNAKGCVEKGDFYKFLRNRVGLITAPFAQWKQQRKQVMMSFSNPVCWSFLPIFNKKANILVENLGRRIGKGDFDLLNDSAECTLDIVLETVMGTSMDIQNGQNLDYLRALGEYLSIITRRIMNVFLHPDIIYKQTKLYQQECDANARSDALHEMLVQKKMSEFNNNNNNEELQEENEHTQYELPQIFIDRLLKLHSKGIVSDEELRDQTKFIILGGQDTSSYTLAMTILLLAMHPHIQKRVTDEIDEVLGDLPQDSDLTMDQINQLVYLEQSIKETLRLYPIIGFIIRHCTEDTQLSNCVIPKDTQVVVSAVTAQRRKDIWGEDADQFNPDHFTEEACAKRHPFAFVAFSGGRRDCIGQRFAYVSMKVILTKILRKYHFSTQMRMDTMKFKLELLNKPVDGIIVQVKNRW